MTESRKRSARAPGRLKQVIREKLRHYCGPLWGERLFTFLQFWELVGSGFMANRCPVRATALAYTTLLALIPMLAVVASISTGILKTQGREQIDMAVEMLVEQLVPASATTNAPTEAGDSTVESDEPSEGADDAKPTAEAPPTATDAASSPSTSTEDVAAGESSTNSTDQTEAGTGALKSSEGDKFSEEKQALKKSIDKNRKQIVDTINNSIQNIQSGSLGVSGMVGLIVVAIMLFSTIEATFNDIWGVAKGRSWVARIVQYWATVTLGPLIPIVVLSLNVTSSLASVQAWMDNLGLGFLVKILISLAPLLVLSFGFAFFYQLMPNTKVNWRASIIGGLTGGLLWQLNNLLGVFYVSRVSTYTKIYDSLGLIPVFLVGLYFSWLILLFGAQVAYAFQNRVAYLQEKEAQRINFLGREYMALRVMTFLGRRFDDVDGVAPNVIEIAGSLRVSTRLIDDILKSMEAGNLVMETRGDGSEAGYTLTRPLEKISCHDVLMTLRTARGDTTESVEDDAKATIDEVFNKVLLAEKTVSSKTTLRDLVDRLAGGGSSQSAPAT